MSKTERLGLFGVGGGASASKSKPEWNLSNKDGVLRDDLRLGNQMPQAATQSQSVLEQLISRATSQGPSQQAQYLQEANQRNIQNSLGQAEELGRTAQAQMGQQLAMRGGLDSGARERMARSGNLSTMLNKQRILNDGQGADLNILAQDEGQKLQTLQALPSSLLSQAGFEQGNKQFDISNTLNTVGNKYKEDMAAWAAMNSAKEQKKAAEKKSGLLGLGTGIL